MSTFHLAAELPFWPDKPRMAAILRSAGLEVEVGRYSIRMPQLPDVVLREYGSDLGDPQIEAATATAQSLLHQATLLSNALAKANITHRCELYTPHDELFAYLHHNWPHDSP